jgi:hypothetical protein
MAPQGRVGVLAEGSFAFGRERAGATAVLAGTVVAPARSQEDPV